MTPVITLTTDFGTGSHYAASMKGAILSINPKVTLVDITHEIAPQNVFQAAFVLAAAVGANEPEPLFPPGTIHVAVVDPGVGTERPIVAAAVGEQRFIAPDNGLLSGVVRLQPPTTLVRLTEPRWWRPRVSDTFHGRDIMAPVAGHLSQGVGLEELGPEVKQMTMLDWPEPVRVRSPKRLGEKGRIAAQVVFVDRFGNLVTNIARHNLIGVPDDRVSIKVAGNPAHVLTGLHRCYAEVPAGTLLALVGSTGYVEIAVNQGSAADLLQAGPGTEVRLAW